MNLNWHGIRPLNGSRSKAFEELCAQLARAENPANAEFERKGSPDAGVECYSVLSDGSEWGWQAKYFETLGKPQFAQLDESVRTAIDKHPKLTRYFVCVPLDRPDARVESQKSAMDRWRNRLTKWQKWTTKSLGREVEFVWWGSSELLEILARPEHIGRVFFWFNKRYFDDSWFNSRLNEAIQAAGPRYTPELHVELPIALDLDCFGRTDASINAVKARAIPIRRTSSRLIPAAKQDRSPHASIVSLRNAIDAVLQCFSKLAPAPAAELPYQAASESVRKAALAAEEHREWLSKQAQEYDAQHPEEAGHRRARRNPFSDGIHHVRRLQTELHSTLKALLHAHKLGNTDLMILKGVAGTGKTHLLCDYTQRRLGANAPTILLMGQRFVSADEPWSQVLNQLDLRSATVEQFTGALEAAAQAANRRVLLIIDALNEGQGRAIWPPHLAAFLAPLEASPWIGVLLSVRSTYERVIVPQEVRDGAATVTHRGFEDEYDATRTFFDHYGLEFPSTPILQPEFRNPLFLKTICEGLRNTGKRRVPRGFHGISAIFNLYLEATNNRLAAELDYNPNDKLVQKAFTKIARLLADQNDRRLDRAVATAAINDLLPRDEYERSLYRGLVSEGLLAEDMILRKKDKHEEIVFVSYERYADHAITDFLLATHLDRETPEVAFAEGGKLAFLCDEGTFTRNGLLEAFCVQVPERTGMELPQLAPALANQWGLRDAFRQSLIWRRFDAFSKATLQVVNELNQTEHDRANTLEVMVTVATLPDHPYNADFLDGNLRRRSMPDRDAGWSIYLHRAWSNRGAVHRMIDWASGVSRSDELDDRIVELCSITLAWMFTTSNRFLRDRATKSLVSLLTGRLGQVQFLVNRFASVNDPYVAERVYAVAYGVVTRSHNAAEVGAVAATVYEQVFADGTPPAHILLRDYARGVIERALNLGSEVDVDQRMIRPPYKSTWPNIPSDADVKPYKADWNSGGGGDGSASWSRNTIGSSVMDNDFAWYVIGTNSSYRNSNWLTRRLTERPWRSSAGREPLRFDLRLIQRYVLKRVFDLGWTTERFGQFDRFDISSSGRKANKPERIGKKYQWIAYHEILAYIADRYQYREQYCEDDQDDRYDGPWQESLRDIDPSMTLSLIPGGTGWEGHEQAWWAPTSYGAWGADMSTSDWMARQGDIPDVKNLLTPSDPCTGIGWINLEGFFYWQQPRPADVDSSDVDRRRLWLHIAGYLVRSDKLEEFMAWAKRVDFWGRWMPGHPKLHRMFFGEYGWSPAFRYFDQLDEGLNEWFQPGHGCPVSVRTTSLRQVYETGGFDCSLDKSFGLQLPLRDFLKQRKLKWTGEHADFVDGESKLAVFDPTAHGAGPTALLARTDLVRRYLEESDTALVWTVLGEKSVMPGGFDKDYQGALHISGAYTLRDVESDGFLTFHPDRLDEGEE